MQIDLAHFDPLAALCGGLLIGLASAAFILLNGRIAGISSIVAGLLTPRSADTPIRLAFLGGLILAPTAYAVFAAVPAPVIEASPFLLGAAGLLVGLGTRFGSGCTSGHGVCGLSRLSVRSLVATLGFMVSGFLTVAMVRHVLLGA